MWSRKFDKCQNCGSTELKHRARGLCTRCYNFDSERSQKKHLKYPRSKLTGKAIKTKRGLASKKLTKKYLLAQYVMKKRSLGDIAIDCGCTRQYVHKKLVSHNIQRRSPSAARKIALEKGKLSYDIEDSEGQIRTLTHKKIEINEHFFSSWSSKMAYVLGIIYTDGSLHRARRMIIGQKDPELLIKIKKLMDCNAELYFRPKKKYRDVVSGKLYLLQINHGKIYDDLIKLGLSPDKSLTVQFPDITPKYVRHFIRGCWDGDGTVYFEGRDGQIKAKFVSGSLAFIEGILAELEKAGLPRRTIYKLKRGSSSYSFQFAATACERLFYYLYDGVSSDQYLKRKYEPLHEYATLAKKARKMAAEGMRLSKIARILGEHQNRISSLLRSKYAR